MAFHSNIRVQVSGPHFFRKNGKNDRDPIQIQNQTMSAISEFHSETPIIPVKTKAYQFSIHTHANISMPDPSTDQKIPKGQKLQN